MRFLLASSRQTRAACFVSFSRPNLNQISNLPDQQTNSDNKNSAFFVFRIGRLNPIAKLTRGVSR
jgi:hypothetical protein